METRLSIKKWGNSLGVRQASPGPQDNTLSSVLTVCL